MEQGVLGVDPVDGTLHEAGACTLAESLQVDLQLTAVVLPAGESRHHAGVDRSGVRIEDREFTVSYDYDVPLGNVAVDCVNECS